MPVGTIGCSRSTGADSAGQLKPVIQSSIMFNVFRSYLKFTDNTRPTLFQRAAVADVSWHFASRMSLGVTAGAVIGGLFSTADSMIVLKSGPVVSIKGSRILLTEYRWIPFVVGGVSVSASWTASQAPEMHTGSFLATDARLSVTAGYTIRDRLQLYLSPKVYGGPIFRFADGKSIRGSDRYFVQAGMGMTLLLPGDLMVFVNGSPLGEQTLGGGIAKIF